MLKLGIYPAYRLWRRKQARRSLQAAVAYSEFMARVHRPHIAGEVLAVRLGLPPVSIKNKARSSGRPLRFGFVAGFQPNKGIWHVLDAAASLKQAGFPFELHIWGPNQEEGARAVAERSLEDRVYLRGMYEREEIWRVYSEMDVAVMATTVCEPFGRVPIEAASVGVPTIAPAVGGITESIRDDVDGLLYRFRDSEHLKQQMQRVLEEKGLVERLTEGLHPAPDLRSMALAIEDLYLSVLGKTHQPAFELEEQLVRAVHQ
jgi:glycosyltransferase involved in cell wall biosynthesis